MQKPHPEDENKRNPSVSLNYYDTHGALTLDSFDPELAEWINT